VVTITPSMVVLNRHIIGGYVTAQCGGLQQLTDRVAGSRAATQPQRIVTLTMCTTVQGLVVFLIPIMFL